MPAAHTRAAVPTADPGPLCCACLVYPPSSTHDSSQPAQQATSGQPELLGCMLREIPSTQNQLHVYALQSNIAEQVQDSAWDQAGLQHV